MEFVSSNPTDLAVENSTLSTESNGDSKHIEEAGILFRNGDYEKAAELYTQILEAKITQNVDPFDVSLAPIYLRYGKCLFYLGQQEIFTKAAETASAALGQAVEEATTANAGSATSGSKWIQLDESVEKEEIVKDEDANGTANQPKYTKDITIGEKGHENEASEKKTKNNETEHDEEEQNEETDGEKEENPALIESDDLQLAWEALDTARLIYLRQPIDSVRHELSDVYLALGDVSMESGAFLQANQDYLESLKLLDTGNSSQVVVVTSDLRCQAEIFYKIALSLEYADNFEDAKINIQTAIKLLKQVLDSSKDLKECEEVRQVIPDLEAKWEDLNNVQRQPSAAQLGVGSSTNGGKGAVDIDESRVTDISAMVKRKSVGSMEAAPEKRAKSDNNTEQ